MAMFEICVVICTIITFMLSGLVINLLQLINYILLRPINFNLFTKINYGLMYSSWSQIVALFDWFFGAQIIAYHSEDLQEPIMFKEHSVFIANHNYELDWIAAWLFTDKYQQLASCKAMLKSDLQYIPIVGWTWRMSDQILLDRNWEKDKHKFESAVDNLLKYKPMVVTFFSEGARCTTEKLKECKKFAEERNLEAPKYHLIPRTKGWCEFVKLVKERQVKEVVANGTANGHSNGANGNTATKVASKPKVWIYNAQVAFDKNQALNLVDIISKRLRPVGHLYLEKIDLDEIPADEKGAAKWLQDLFLKKDKLYEYFLEHNSFPGFKDRNFITYKPRIMSLVNWLFWLGSSLALMITCYRYFGQLYVTLFVLASSGISYGFLSHVIYESECKVPEKP